MANFVYTPRINPMEEGMKYRERRGYGLNAYSKTPITFKGLPVIKFSKKYKKMPDVLSPTKVTLVYKIHFRSLPTTMVLEDTLATDGTYYTLPDGELLFIGLETNGHKWQTYRPWNKGKEHYYKSLVGKEVKIVIDNQS